MMFKKRTKRILVGFCSLLISFSCIHTQVFAESEEKLPKGDILIVYSGAIENQDMEKLNIIVSELTWQGFLVTYAPAAECIGQLHNYTSIIFFQVDKYPASLLQEIQEREILGNCILTNRSNNENSSGENDVRLMFIGNELLQTYLKGTGRQSDYIEISKQVGKVSYSFDTFGESETLVKENKIVFLTGELDESRGTIEVDDYTGYVMGRIGSISHIPITDLDNNLIKAAVSKELSLWKWPYNGEPHTYAQYITINKVYPFQDPDKLLDIINYMVTRKEPYIISVMPVYANGNYPAMQHFCEVLRYAQANGGVILMHSPINQMTEFDEELVNDYITTAIQIYMNQGVYPMGLQVPINWIQNEETVRVMSRFRTILIDETIDSQIQAGDFNSNIVYRDGHQWIAPAILLEENDVSHLKTYSTAVYFDMTDDMDKIEQKVQACITSEVPLKSLWDIEHSFWTNEDNMTYKNHIILLNGKQIDNTFIPTEYDENFKYNRNMLQRFSADLASENQKLIAMVVVVAIIFFVFILLARHRNRKQFIKKK